MHKQPEEKNILLNITPRHPIYYPTNDQELEELRLLHRKMLRPQHLAAHVLIPGISHMSPSRSVMAIQQASQHLVWDKLEKPIVLTGAEYEFGDYAFKDKMPENGQIVAVIPRYPRSSDPKTIKNNPETIVIYLREDQVLDYFSIKSWGSYHTQFGYMKRFKEENMNKLVEGRNIPKGTVFAQSPGIADDGCYCMGVNLRVAYVDDESLAEDGMVFREGIIDEKFVIDTFEEFETGIGTKNFPINSWGKDGDYQIFPEIGEFVGLDGYIMAKRKWDTPNAPVMMSNEALKTLDGIFDDPIYTKATPVREGDDPSKLIPPEVIDVVVIRNPRAKRLLPPSMAGQLERYALVYQTFQHNLLKIEQRLTANLKKRDPKAELKMTERLQVLFSYAYGITDFGATRFQSPTEFQTHRAKADEWTVRITVRHRRRATVGDKFTGLMGDKGVAVEFAPDADFPEGVDAMVASASTIGRTNTNRFFVPRWATAAYDLTEDMREGMGFKPKQKLSMEDILRVPPESFDHWSKRLLLFYAIVSPHLYTEYSHRDASKEKLASHIAACLNEIIHPVMPVDNPIDDGDSVIHLAHHGFLKPYKHITYRNRSGKIETSDRPVPVLWTYIEALEKLSEDGSATSFGKLQHHGLLASRSNAERHQYNFRNVATRNIGQHESEILTHDASSPEFIAEFLDRSNNPDVMRSMSIKLLSEDKPTALEELVDRTKQPLGESRPIQFLRHFYEVAGAKLSFMTEEEAALLPNLEEQARNTEK